MSATLTIPPATRAFAGDPIWINVETDLITGTAAYFEITITNGGPSASETLTLTWPGGSITYTADATPDNTGLQWPLQGAATLEAYTNSIAEVLRQREDVAEVFDVSIVNAPGGVIRLTRNTVETFDLTVTTDTMTNVAVTATDGTAVSAEDNLRAYVEVWTDSGAFNTDARLIALHSPYDVETAATDIDISAAFAHLKAHLPDPDTIQIGLSLALPVGAATDAMQKYYLRYADKYGSPAVAEALERSAGSYYALLGSLAGDYVAGSASLLHHNYQRRARTYDPYTASTSRAMRKPIGDTQPDWVYLSITGTDDPTDVYVECLLYWSDGTTSIHQPYDTDTTSLAANTIYWIIAGFRQLKINGVAPSGGTDPDAYVVAYDWILRKVSDNSALAAAYYQLQYLSSWNYFLLFSNGQGGCETAGFFGKATERYKTQAEKFRRPRRPDWDVSQHENQVLSLEGAREWELHSGWTTDADWLDHLRQLCLSDSVWLVDIGRPDLDVNDGRFLAVTVETSELETRKDDETLFNLSITVRAAWIDTSANA